MNKSTTILKYTSDINRVFDYIEKNIRKDIELEQLTEVVNMSKYHFIRIFKSVMNETPMAFVQRIRLERVASQLVNKPNESITNIAQEYNYDNMTVFAKNFKMRFGISATEWRKNSNKSKLNSNNEILANEFSAYFCDHSQTIKWRTDMLQNKTIVVNEFPIMTVAYVRHTGQNDGDVALYKGLQNKLFTWAASRNLLNVNSKYIIIYHDDPNVVPAEKQRMSLCLTIPSTTKVDGDIGKMEVQGGKYVVARFELKSDEFHLAWKYIMDWFPKSGYKPRNEPPFEMYPEEPIADNFKVDICIPID